MQRIEYQVLLKRLEEPRRFIQLVMGPRQVGKTTLAQQVLHAVSLPHYFFSADGLPATQPGWIANCWQVARSRLEAEQSPQCVLVFDEIQKVGNWSEQVKREWDDDT